MQTVHMFVLVLQLVLFMILLESSNYLLMQVNLNF
jgi:hypothetical protein